MKKLGESNSQLVFSSAGFWLLTSFAQFVSRAAELASRLAVIVYLLVPIGLGLFITLDNGLGPLFAALSVKSGALANCRSICCG